MLVHLIAAARPNFMKVAPIYHALSKADWCQPILIHTGQHYDANMSQSFLQDLGLPEPHFHLGVGSGSHAEQTAGVMIAYEKVCQEQQPEWVVVVGDVNSTLACTLTAKKLHLNVAHLEAGLRSGDRTMPEEINRIVTDSIADLLWTPSEDGDENLRREGIPEYRISRIGNIMIDSYEMLRRKIEVCSPSLSFRLPEKYGVVTLHRPVNVDHYESLSQLTKLLIQLSESVPLIFPIHPRTRQRLISFELWEKIHNTPNLYITEPLSYIPFMHLITKACLVITDSGGIQEETTYLDIPCLTLRETTERPITITKGTNRLVNVDTIEAYVQEILLGRWVHGVRPELWDGHTAERAAADLASKWKGKS